MTTELQNILIDNAWWIAIICCLLCFLITGWQISKYIVDDNLTPYRAPIIIILLGPSCYCLCAAMDLWWSKASGSLQESFYIYPEIIQNVYKAVCLYSFVKLLQIFIAFNQDTKIVDHTRIYQILATKGTQHYVFPMKCIWKPIDLNSVSEGKSFYAECNKGIFQYIFFCLLSLMIQLIFQICSTLSTQSIAENVIGGVLMVSIFFAIYYLVMYYRLFYREILRYHPFLKFLSVSMVIFFTTWQQIIVTFFSKPITKFIEEDNESSTTQITSLLTLLCLLVAIQMVIISLITAVAFSHRQLHESVLAVRNQLLI